MTTKQVAAREARLRGLTEQVGRFDPTNPVHLAHFLALKPRFGEMGAAALVAQDVTYATQAALADPGVAYGLELTDPGAIETHPGWRKLNRVVRHGEKSHFWIYDFEGDRIVPLFTRDQTVPAYAQEG